MEQLILHLFGDYITQTDWMAKNKRTQAAVAFIHATIYSIPFVLLTQSIYAWMFIQLTHFFIDYYGLARYVVFAKNWITSPHLKWNDCPFGYSDGTPPYMAFWLLIIADNTLHLACNYIAIRWF